MSFQTLDARCLLAADLSLIDDGLRDHFTGIQAIVNDSVFDVPAPFIGDQLASDFRAIPDDAVAADPQFLSSLSEKLANVVLTEGGTTIADAKAALSSALGIDAADILVTGQDGESDVQFQITLTGNQHYDAALDLRLVGADPEIELLLGAENQVDLTLNWTYRLKFGVREGAGGASEFYVDASSADELQVTYSATIRDDFASGKGRVGVFVAEIGAATQPSVFQGVYTLDVSKDAAENLAVSGALAGTGSAHLAIDASFFPSFLPEGSDGLINLGVRADGRVNYDGVQIGFNADGTLNAGNNQVVVGFDNVRLDIGKVYSDFVEPIIFKLQENLRPIKPVIDFLTQPVPVISELYELAGLGPRTALALGRYAPDSAVAKAVGVVNTILNYDGLIPSGGDQTLFSFEFVKSGVDPETEREDDRDDRIQESLDKLANGEIPLFLPDGEVSTQWQWNTQFGGAVDLPFLTDYDKLAGFLLGDATGELFTFDLNADFAFKFGVDIPIAPLLNLVQLNAGFEFNVGIDLDGGYDVLGIQNLTSVADFSSEEALRQSLQDNREFLWHGFYLDDHNAASPGNRDNDSNDAPEVTLGVQVSGGISAGLDLGIVEFTVGGNIVFEGQLAFDLNDLPDPQFGYAPGDPLSPVWDTTAPSSQWIYDGRVRIPELATIVDANAAALFNLDGQLEVGLDATLTVRVLGISILDETWELFRATLVDGGIYQPDDAAIIHRNSDPVRLAALDNGVLRLNTGNSAALRNYHSSDSAETFFIQPLGNSRQGGESLAVTFQPESGERYTQYYHGVTRVTASGGSDDDVIHVFPGVESEVELEGGTGDDRLIYEGSGTAILRGDDGNDTLRGGAGNDQIMGGTGDDRLEGVGGNDLIEGGTGDDQLYGGAGDDELLGHEGDDYLDGGHGDDLLRGGTGDDLLRGGVGSDAVYGDAGDDRIQFGFVLDDPQAVDQIFGGANSDLVEVFGTEEADDFLVEQLSAGVFQVTNGPHASFQFELPDDVSQRDIEELQISGLGGDDRIQAAGNLNVNRVRIDGGDGNDTLIGSDGVDLIIGGDGDDSLDGGAGDDELFGGAGADVLLGGDGNDAVYGDDGNDNISGGAGDDVSHGGAGDDYIEAGEGVFHDILFGSAGNDTLVGGAGADVIFGGSGNDLLEGHGGNDVLYGEVGGDTLIGGAGADYLNGGDDDDKLWGDLLGVADPYDDGQNVEIDLLVGGQGNDLLNGGQELTPFFGRSVPSSELPTTLTIDGSDAADGLRVVFSNENSIDVVRFDPATGAPVGGSETYQLATGGQLFVNGLAGDDVIQVVGETTVLVTISAGEGNDVVLGGDGDEVIFGDLGDDLLFGGAGHDLLDGGEGRDVAVGGDGDDQLEAGAGIYGDLLLGGGGADALFGGAGRDILEGDDGNDFLDGGDFDDIINGGEGDDILVGGWGRDVLSGGAGNDQLSALHRDQITLDPIEIAQRRDALLAAKSDLETASLQSVEGTPEWTKLRDQLLHVGRQLDDLDVDNNDRHDVLIGGAGDDALYASPFQDFLYGGDGNDALYDVTLTDSSGADSNYDVIAGGLGADTYFTHGTQYADTIYLRLVETASNPQVYAEIESETGGSRSILLSRPQIEAAGLQALGGDDTVTVQFESNAALEVNIDGGDGNDVLDASTLQHNAILRGGAGDDVIYGGQGDDFLYGDVGHDRLYGGAGNDHLEGGSHGNDRLYGEAGDDTLIGAYDYLYGGDGNDLLTVADVNSGAFNYEARGESGDDTLYGGAGADVLNGGAGNDTVVGGAGDDIIQVAGDDALYDAHISGGAGYDTIVNTNPTADLRLSNVNYDKEVVGTVSEGIERIDGNGGALVGDDNRNVFYLGNVDLDVTEVRTAGGNDHVSGTSLADNFYYKLGSGNDSFVGAGYAINYVYGEAGDDRLTGGAGIDYLYGGDGNDFLSGLGGKDYLFGQNGIDTLHGGDGNDALRGGNHNDFLYGGNHNDTLYGDSGADSLYGDYGNDYLNGGRDGYRDYLDGGWGADTLIQYQTKVWYPVLWWWQYYWANQETIATTYSDDIVRYYTY